MATDAEIRARGINFLSPQRYLQNPYELPTNTPVVEEETKSFGIPNTNSFTNSGGNNFSGSFNNNSFQQAVDARQNRLNKPTDTSTFMGRTMGKVRDFMNPQSANEIMEDGYQEPRFQPGIIGTILGKIDNYRNLPQANQAFISSRMGYTGPTIFGANNSGLSKDPYGINTRSAFGDYASYVEKKSGELKEYLDKSKNNHIDKYGSLDDVNKYGKTWAEMNNLNIEKTGFYEDEDEEFQGLKDKQYKNRIKGFVESYKRPGVKELFEEVYDGNNIHNNPPGTPPPGGDEKNDGGFDKAPGPDPTGSKERGFNMHGDGKMADGGRAGYFFGGRVNYKIGGVVHPDGRKGFFKGAQADTSKGESMSPGTDSSGGFRGGNDGASDNPPKFFIEDKPSIVDTSGLTSKSPEINIDYTDPRNYASLKGSIYNKNILDNDDINVDGTLSGEIGPVSYNTNFTDQGITGTNLKAGNFTADIDANKNYSLGYANNYNGIDYGARYDNNGNLMLSAGAKFKNGGLAGLL